MRYLFNESNRDALVKFKDEFSYGLDLNLDDLIDEYVMVEEHGLDFSLDSDIFYPLFLEDSNIREGVCASFEGLTFLKSIKKRIDFFRDNDLNTYPSGWINSSDFNPYDQGFLLHTGFLPLHIFGKDFFGINYRKFGFNTFEDMAYTVGADIINNLDSSLDSKTLKFDLNIGGNILETKYWGDTNGDFYISQRNKRFPLSETVFKDLVGVVPSDLLTYKTICGGQTNEIPFLMTLINCIDSVGLRHPYLDDLTSFYEMAYAGTPQLAGNFGDFGCSTLGDSARSQFIGFEEDYILTEKDEKNTGHSYYTSRHTSKCYYFPILKNDTFEFFGAILNNNKWSYKSNPSLVFQKDDLPELLLQFFRGTRNGFWRTSTHQIEPILNHYVEKYYSS